MKVNTGKKLVISGMVLSVVLMAGLFMQSDNIKAETSVSAGISARRVSVGSRLRVKAKTSGVSYASSNSTVACVDPQGVVTGKKAGKVTISVRKKGYAAKTFSVRVVKNGRKPATLPVTFSEISIKERGNTVTVSNRAKKGTIKKIICFYEVPVEEKVPETESGGVAVTGNGAEGTTTKTATTLRTRAWTANSIAPGRSAVCKGDADAVQTPASQRKLTKVELYAGDALYIFDPVKHSYTFQWGTKDTKAPVFSGLLKNKSATGNGDAYQIYYSDKKDSYDFKRFVTAVDDRDGRVNVRVDMSKVNWKKQGVYRIYYHAKDRAGNTATTWAKVQILIPGSPESAADQVLRSITRKGWSDTKKARAIYRYVKGRSSYVQNSSHAHWRTAALRGLRYQSGDCYTYYAMCRLLLTRAGIPNVMIKRDPTNYGRHFWNLTYVQGAWYHFDTTPRTRGGDFCLQTDAQMFAVYSGYTFRFKQSLYPKRATKKI
ncbi:MAG: Ig-like domain-containing protein [Roseburia sp.]|nr:Ig-like domain-containing protein [Roseburia sp.]